jgi:7-cyano-7-deazaguanine synthase in queuosine biosynthesis
MTTFNYRKLDNLQTDFSNKVYIENSQLSMEQYFSRWLDAYDILEIENKKIIVPISGGSDSVFSLFFLNFFGLQKNIIPVFIDFGQPYLHKEQKEIKNLVKMGFDIRIIKIENCLTLTENYPTWNNAGIHARNQAIISICAMFSPDIIVVSNPADDRNYIVNDCTDTFRQLSTDLTSFVLGKDTKIVSSMVGLTKSDAYSFLLKKNINLSECSTSCHDINYNNCGKCLSCFKRKVQEINNNKHYSYICDPFLHVKIVEMINKPQSDIWLKELVHAYDKYVGTRE